MGNRRTFIQSALTGLARYGIVVKEVSRLYLSAPYNLSEAKAQDFINVVCRVECSLTPELLLDCCRKIEESLGRKRQVNSVISRTIDIDLLFYDNIICKTESLTLPHPEALKRDFVLLPFGEVVLHNWKDPLTGQTYKQALDNFHSLHSKSSCRSILTTIF